MARPVVFLVSKLAWAFTYPFYEKKIPETLGSVFAKNFETPYFFGVNFETPYFFPYEFDTPYFFLNIRFFFTNHQTQFMGYIFGKISEDLIYNFSR